MTPDEEADLHWRFSGDVEAALGMRSWLGPMQQRLVEGRTRSGSSPGGDESGRVAEAALRLGAIDRRLAAADLAVAQADELAGRPRREGGSRACSALITGPTRPERQPGC